MLIYSKRKIINCSLAEEEEEEEEEQQQQQQ